MIKKTAKIINCTRNLEVEINCWYKDKIGSIIEVYDCGTPNVRYCEYKPGKVGKISLPDIEFISVKVLTLWQPWASLFAAGIKTIETRPKPTNHTIDKGIYLIHAAKKWDKFQRDICNTHPFKHLIESNKLEMSLGAIIGSIEIVRCNKIVSEIPGHSDVFLADNNDEIIEIVNHNEIPLGDYRTGRFAWIGINPKLLIDPVPYKNGQGYYQNFKGDINQLKFK